MPPLLAPWLTLAIGLPLVAALAVGRLRSGTRALLVAAAALGLSLAAALGASLELSLRALPAARDPVLGWLGGPAGLWSVDALSALLVPCGALIGCVVAGVAPRAWRRPRAVARLLLGHALVLATFSTTDAWALAALWGLALVPPWLELRDGGPSLAPTRRVFTVYMAMGWLLLAAGIVLLERGGPAVAPWAPWLVLGAVLTRRGLVPAHSWIPELVEKGPLASMLLFTSPQIATYAAVRLVLSDPEAGARASVEVLRIAALGTALYGSLLALGARDARRAFAWIFMSQSALVLAGLGGASALERVGALALWLSSSLALTGFGLTLWALEVRRGGALSLARHQGGFERTPELAASFLVLGLGSVGLPGTLGAVGTDLLLAGSADDRAWAGVVMAATIALNGITVMRAYFALFCGARDPAPASQPLRGRERAGVIALVLVMVVTGFAPRLVLGHGRAAERLAVLLGPAGPAPVALVLRPASRGP